MRIKVTKNYLRSLIKEEVKKALVLETMNPVESLEDAVATLSRGAREIIQLPDTVKPCDVWKKMGRKSGLAIGYVASISNDPSRVTGPGQEPSERSAVGRAQSTIMGSLIGLRHLNRESPGSVTEIQRVGDMCKTERRRKPAQPARRTVRPPAPVQDDIPLVNPYED